MPVTICKITAKELKQLGMWPRHFLHTWGQNHTAGWFLAVAFRQIKSVKGQPHASKNGRNPEFKHVTHILLLLQNVSVNYVTLLPWTWEDLYDYADQKNKQKWPYATSKASHKKAGTLPHLLLEGSVCAVRKAGQLLGENTHRCSSWQPLFGSNLTGSINSQSGSEWGFGWF